MIAREQILPTVILAISACAGAVYLGAGDWRRGGYWFSAAAITFFVTF